MKQRLSATLRILSFVAAAVVLALVTSTAAAGELNDDVAVAIDPPTSSVVLGENLDLRVSVTNNGGVSSPPLVVHLDITNPDQSTSVDPEDWTATLSQSIGEVGPGETVVVHWTIQPISPGTFATYAIALSPGVDNIAASNILEVQVADQRSLNPGEILPVAIAAPTLVGLLLLAQTRLSRRDRHRTSPRLARATP